MASSRASATSIPSASSTPRQPDSSSSSSSFASRSSVAPITSQSLFTDVLPDTTHEDSRNGDVAATTDAISIELQPVEQQPGQQEQRRTRSSRQRPFSSPPLEHSTSQSSTVFNKSRPSSANSKGAISARSVLPMKVMEVSPLPVINRNTTLQEVKVEVTSEKTETSRSQKSTITEAKFSQLFAVKTPANVQADEYFTFQILTPQWQSTRIGHIDVVAYPPGVDAECFLAYLKERDTLTAHKYPFLDLEIKGWSLLTIPFLKEVWQTFVSPMSVIVATTAGLTFSPIGIACLAVILIFTTYLLWEFTERKRLYYALLNHRIVINFHNVVWYQSRRFWVIICLSLGFILDCWLGLTDRGMYVVANNLFAYGLAIKSMLEMEDNLLSFSRMKERYADRCCPFPSYIMIDENVLRFYLWKMNVDWNKLNLSNKQVRFSLAPFVFAIQMGRLYLNVTLVESTSWSHRIIPPKSLALCCYNKCYGTTSLGNVDFNLSPTWTLFLTLSKSCLAIEARKRFAVLKKESSVLLIVERGCFFEYPAGDSSSSPNLVIPLSKDHSVDLHIMDEDCQITLLSHGSAIRPNVVDHLNGITFAWTTSKSNAQKLQQKLAESTIFSPNNLMLER